MKDKKKTPDNKPKQKEQEKTTTEAHVPGGGIKTKPPKE